jgi:hypothetical protein
MPVKEEEKEETVLLHIGQNVSADYVIMYTLYAFYE